MELKDNNKYLDVVLTDAQIHAKPFRNPKTFIREVTKSIRNHMPFRAHTNQVTFDPNSDTIEMVFDLPEIRRQAEVAKAQGKILRIILPKGGVPLILSQDGQKKMKAEAKKVKRIEALTRAHEQSKMKNVDRNGRT